MVTQQKITEIASELFLKHGVKVVTIDRIVSELRTSKRTIYKFFKDKDELLTDCIWEYHKKVRNENEEIIHNAPNAIAAMGLLHQKILERAYTINPNFYPDIFRFHPNLESEIEKAGLYAKEEMLYLANWGIDDGIFVDDLDIEVVGTTVLCLLKLFKDHQKFPMERFSRERLTFGTLVPYMRGLCTSKGLELLKKQEELFRVSI